MLNISHFIQEERNGQTVNCTWARLGWGS